LGEIIDFDHKITLPISVVPSIKSKSNTLTPQNFSLEKMLLAQPNWLIEISDQQSYNEQAELLTHPLVKKHFENRPHFRIPMKYTYCFDHGVWLGAERIYSQYHASSHLGNVK
jgi:iron complex transport system substrate-binding protein